MKLTQATKIMTATIITAALFTGIAFSDRATFQGRITQNGVPVDGTFAEIEVTVEDGTGAEATASVQDVNASNGIVKLDLQFGGLALFGMVLEDANLKIRVKRNPNDSFVELDDVQLGQSLMANQAKSLTPGAKAMGTVDLDGNPITNIGTGGTTFLPDGGLKVVNRLEVNEDDQAFNAKVVADAFASQNNQAVLTVNTTNAENGLEVNANGTGKAAKFNGKVEVKLCVDVRDFSSGLGDTKIEAGKASFLNMGGQGQVIVAGSTGSTNITNGDVQTQTINAMEIIAAIKNFQIDHPLDPDNMYLKHASIESSEMVNIYSGNVVTDDRGFATVALPDWFEALNTDFRYQLTPIGSFTQTIIAQKISDGAFVIQSKQPGVEISWQVTGVRQDTYAKEHPLVVELHK